VRVKTNYPSLWFSETFPQQLRIFKQNFTRLLYVHIYGKLQNFIQLTLNLSAIRPTSQWWCRLVNAYEVEAGVGLLYF